MLPPAGGGPFYQKLELNHKRTETQSKGRCAAETMGTYEERNRGGVCVCSFLFLMSTSEAFQNLFKIVNAY